MDAGKRKTVLIIAWIAFIVAIFIKMVLILLEPTVLAKKFNRESNDSLRSTGIYLNSYRFNHIEMGGCSTLLGCWAVNGRIVQWQETETS